MRDSLSQSSGLIVMVMIMIVIMIIVIVRAIVIVIVIVIVIPVVVIMLMIKERGSALKGGRHSATFVDPQRQLCLSSAHLCSGSLMV